LAHPAGGVGEGMALKLEELLAPVAGDDPCGPDLTYETERYEIEQAFERSVSIDASGAEAETADVDWRRILQLIEAQSLLTKDVWLAVYMARAGVRSGSLATTQTGLKYLAGLLETYWAGVHPTLEEYGFQGRKGACDSLAGLAEFVNPLWRLMLVEHPRLGRFTARDFARFQQGGEGEDGYGLFRAALDDSPPGELLEVAGRLMELAGDLKRVDVVLTRAAQDGSATNFTPTYEALEQIRRSVLAFTAAPVEEGADGEADPAAADEGAANGRAGAGARISGRVESREDVTRAIDAVCDYYRRREPASPVLHLMQRAREWVQLDFLELLEDIAPGSLDEVKRILVARPKTPPGQSSGW
jgi:type VI secretion system ImpA family protein